MSAFRRILPAFVANIFWPVLRKGDTSYEQIGSLHTYQLPQISSDSVKPFAVDFDGDSTTTLAQYRLPELPADITAPFEIDFDAERGSISSLQLTDLKPECSGPYSPSLEGSIPEHCVDSLLRSFSRPIVFASGAPQRLKTPGISYHRSLDTSHVACSTTGTNINTNTRHLFDSKDVGVFDWYHPITSIRYLYQKDPFKVDYKSTDSLDRDSLDVISDIHTLFEVGNPSASLLLNLDKSDDESVTRSPSPALSSSDDDTDSLIARGSSFSSSSRATSDYQYDQRIKEFESGCDDGTLESEQHVEYHVFSSNRSKFEFNWADDVEDEINEQVSAPKKYTFDFNWDDEYDDVGMDPLATGSVQLNNELVLYETHHEAERPLGLSTYAPPSNQYKPSEHSSVDKDMSEDKTSNSSKSEASEERSLADPDMLTHTKKWFRKQIPGLLREVSTAVRNTDYGYYENRKELGYLEAHCSAANALLDRVYHLLDEESGDPFLYESVNLLGHLYHQASPHARTLREPGGMASMAPPMTLYRTPSNAAEFDARQLARVDALAECLKWNGELRYNDGFGTIVKYPSMQEVQLHSHGTMKYWRCAPSALRVCKTYL